MSAVARPGDGNFKVPDGVVILPSEPLPSPEALQEASCGCGSPAGIGDAVGPLVGAGR